MAVADKGHLMLLVWCFVFLLVHCVVYVRCDWLMGLIWCYLYKHSLETHSNKSLN